MDDVPVTITTAARSKRVAASMAVGALAAALLVSVGGARPTATTAPTLYVLYTMNCTFTIQNDAGQTVTSIPPGQYQVDVRTPVQFGTLPLPASPTDMTACRGFPQFQLTGPGVNLFTTMTAGCQDDNVYPETFQPNATYTAVDMNQPTVANASFTTQASGAPVAPTVTYGGGKGTAETSTDIVGAEALQGTLRAVVGVKGTLSLTKAGKRVSTLQAGRYKFAIDDKDGKAGLVVLGPKSTAPKTLSGVAFRGKRSVTLPLTAGRWAYYTSLRTIRYFRVA